MTTTDFAVDIEAFCVECEELHDTLAYEWQQACTSYHRECAEQLTEDLDEATYNARHAVIDARCKARMESASSCIREAMRKHVDAGKCWLP
jgi:hypothetical protein